MGAPDAIIIRWFWYFKSIFGLLLTLSYMIKQTLIVAGVLAGCFLVLLIGIFIVGSRRGIRQERLQRKTATPEKGPPTLVQAYAEGRRLHAQNPAQMVVDLVMGWARQSK